MDCYIFQVRFIVIVRILRMAVFFCCKYKPVLTFVCYWSRLFQLQFRKDMRDEEKGNVYKILFGKP